MRADVCRQGVLTQEELTQIITELDQIHGRLDRGELPLRMEL